VRPLLPVSLLLLSLVAAACLAEGETDTALSAGAGSQAASAGSQGAAGGAGRPAGISLPTLVPQFERRLETVRLVESRLDGARAERVRERLLADGTGNFTLEPVAWQPPTGPMVAPPPEVLAAYRDRQRYFVRYRDPRVLDPLLAQRNYAWSEEPGTFLVAGRSCRKYLARSVHGFGEFEFLADETDGLLLGWAWRDAQGVEHYRVVTESLSFSPDLSGATWSAPLVPEAPYDPAVHDPLLGMTPLVPGYLPAGFVTLRERFLETEPTYPEIPYTYVREYGDGLQVLFLAQQRPLTGALGQPFGSYNLSTLVRVSSVGPVEVLETSWEDHHVLLAGLVPRDELLAIVPSLAARP